ncbi:hypothetical protein Tco_0409739 [Tanacetum coccineum]
MKAKRRAHVVISDDEQAEEEQGKNLMQELDLEALVPLHLATEGRFDDSQVSEPLEEQLDVFSVAKVLAESARKRRSAEVVQTYTRRRSRVSTSSVDVNTASRAVSIAGVSTADVQAKDKGKAIMEEHETPNKVKKRVQLDERQEVQTQATQEIDWSDPAVLRYHATQNRTFSKAEVRKNMIMYLKNQGGYKMNYFKGMTYEEIRPIFEKVWDQTQSFVPMDSEKEKESAKKAGGEKAELKECLNIVEDEVEVIEPLSAKAPITDWGIHSLGICSLYIADRADGSSKMYRFFSDMLKSFNMQDLEDMYKLVKETHKMKKPEAEALVLWGDLKTIFEPDESDEIWKNQQDHTLIEWRLFDSYGVHSLVMGTIAIYMLVERQYPLTQEMLERMLNWRLQIDHECEMAYALIRYVSVMNVKGQRLSCKGLLMCIKGDPRFGINTQYPSGFTPVENDAEKGDAQCVDNFYEPLSTNSGNKNDSGSSKGAMPQSSANLFSKVHTGGSFLEVMDELVKVSQTMGYNMEGCMKNIEVIIGSHGDVNFVKSNSMVNLKKKLQILKQDIKTWSKEVRKSSLYAKQSIQKKLSDVDKVLDQSGYSKDTMNYRSSLLKELHDINSIEASNIA